MNSFDFIELIEKTVVSMFKHRILSIDFENRDGDVYQQLKYNGNVIDKKFVFKTYNKDDLI
ncbi:MAG: hypothetical protein J6D03_03250 [Clostridia bacterium]|nr:hypothetical protein [Clostridia bacterium]